MNYGLINKDTLPACVHVVCNVLGAGKNGKAVDMMMETAAVETGLGSIPDRHETRLGVGVFQMDEIAFNDVQARTRNHNLERIKSTLGVDVRSVSHSQLAYSPMLAAIFCRLFYILIPEEFPNTLEARSSYWKEYYNTELGKGSQAHYQEMTKKYLGSSC